MRFDSLSARAAGALFVLLVFALGQPAHAEPRRLEPSGLEVLLHVERGDTLAGLIDDAGVSRAQGARALAALETVFSPRRLRPGQAVRLLVEPLAESGTVRLRRLEVDSGLQRRVTVRSYGGGLVAEVRNRPLRRLVRQGAGVIDGSLFVAGRDAGVPASVLARAIRALSFEVDFQRQIRRGDGFELLYEVLVDDQGARVRDGELLHAALTLSGERLDIYRFETSDGTRGYFHPDGTSARRGLMRTPVDGARLSSGYGRRRHPVLGYSRVHKGVDFAAPTGTPIYAAGDGVVVRAGRYGSYGHYVRIRHNGEFQTAYAHLSRYGPGIRRGRRVSQGDVIGYVGATGRTTGPHLHYEILVSGSQVNPLRIELPSGDPVPANDTERFDRERREIDARRGAIAAAMR